MILRGIIMRTFKPSKLSIALLSCGFMMSSRGGYAQEAVENTPKEVDKKTKLQKK
jgi:hypothetical protein